MHQTIKTLTGRVTKPLHSASARGRGTEEDVARDEHQGRWRPTGGNPNDVALSSTSTGHSREFGRLAGEDPAEPALSVVAWRSDAG